MTFWQYRLPNGDPVSTEADQAPAPDAVEIPRMPVDGEHWDEGLGDFVLNRDVAADMAVTHDHIRTIHPIKQLEAVMIKSGVTLTTGLLAGEAVLRGLTLDQMADLVLSQAQDRIAAELERMERKIQS